MNFLKRHTEITIILVVGLILRLSISFTHSYSNDELSAINRLQYTNFSELIESGVMTGDMHPAGVQVFMKAWSILFGLDEGPMRLPFVLLGVLSILVLYKIGLKWINKRVGIFAALFLSFLYFPIMNSEFARPYSPGLFFSLLAGWYYLKILFSDDRKWMDAVFLGLAFAGAMYSHHFAFLFIAWMGVSGLMFTNKTSLKYIVFSGLLGILLYLPHIGITQYQLSVGGLQWLAPPESNWIFQFLYHAFNESFLIVLLILQFLVMSLVFRNRENKGWTRQLTFMLLLFVGIYIIGFVYSYIGTPVLKFPVMLFPLPFLFLLMGYLLSQFRMQNALFIVLSIALLSSTIFEKDLFGNRHYELFREVSDDILNWENEYGAENIYTVYNLNNPGYMNFYANQQGREIDFDWDVLEFGDAVSLREDLKNRKEEYLIIGYSARLTLLQVFETCKEFYPNIIDGQEYNNSAVYLLSKTHPASYIQEETNLSLFSPELSNKDWLFHTDNNELLIDSASGFNQIKYRMNEFGPEFKFKLSDISNYKEKYIKVTVTADVPANGKLTASFTARRNGEILQNRGENYWEGRDLEQMIIDSGTGYFTFKIPKFIDEKDELIISLWNRDLNYDIFIDLIEVKVLDNIWN